MFFGSFGDDATSPDSGVTSAPDSSVTISPAFDPNAPQQTIVSGGAPVYAPTMTSAAASQGPSLKTPLIIGAVAVGIFAIGYLLKSKPSALQMR